MTKHKYEKDRHIFYEYDEKFNIINSKIVDEK